MGWLAISFIIHQFHDVKKIYKFVKFIVDIHNLLEFFFLLLPSKWTNLGIGGLWLSALYRSSVTQILLFGQSTASITLWTRFSCSSKSLDSVDWRTGYKFCSLRKLTAATTSWFLCRINWLKSASHIVKICLCLNSAFMLSLLNTFSWKFR